MKTCKSALTVGILLTVSLVAQSISAQMTSGSYDAFRAQIEHQRQPAEPAGCLPKPWLSRTPALGAVGRLPYGMFRVRRVLGPDVAEGYYQFPTRDDVGRQPAVLSGISTTGIADGYPIVCSNLLTVAATRKVETLVGERTLIELRPAK
jgi:hypothetical protein